jgi:hypothetical protein
MFRNKLLRDYENNLQIPTKKLLTLKNNLYYYYYSIVNREWAPMDITISIGIVMSGFDTKVNLALVFFDKLID